jgi:hypothetical protein
MTVRPWVCALAVALAGVGGVACSDDADGPSTTTLVSTTLLPETLDAAGQRSFLLRVCTDPDQGGAIGDPVDDSSTVEEIDAQYDAIETRLELMREVPVPSGEEAAFDEVVQAYDRVLTALDELSTAVADDDTQGAVLVASALEGLRDDVEQLAADYGIDDCSL